MAEFPEFNLLQQVSQSIPLFPLGRTVILPYTILPLHVFEPRYVQLVKHIKENHNLFAIPRLKDLHDMTDEEKLLHQHPIYLKVVI